MAGDKVFFVPLSQRECIKPPGVRRVAAVCVVSDGRDMLILICSLGREHGNLETGEKAETLRRRWNVSE